MRALALKDPRDTKARVHPYEEVPTKQEGITDSEGAGSEAQDLHPLKGPNRNYQVIAHNLKEIRERKHTQGDPIRALCKKLGNVQPEGLVEAVDSLPTQKKVDELEAKNDFLLEKANKLWAELKETKEDHKAIDKLNVAFTFNEKLEAYVDHISDVVNKARLFDANLAKNPVSAEKVIPILVDFAEKMEELLNKMRALFDGLQVLPPSLSRSSRLGP